MALNPGQTTLGNVKATARQYADMVNSTFISEPELTGFVQQSQLELYDLLLTKYSTDYFVDSPFLITTDGVNDTFALPPNFYKLLGLDLQLSGTPGDPRGFYIPLRPFNWSERIRYSTPYVQAVYPGVAYPRYRIRGNLLWLAPVPNAALTLRLWHAPRLVLPQADTDIIDGVSGWEDMIALDAAIKMRQKEESDVSVLAAQKSAMMSRIESAAENRDENGPYVVADTRNRDAYAYPGWGWGGVGGDGDFY